MKQQNLYSHLTAKKRERLSFPAKIILEKKLLKGNILDFGCGFGKDVGILRDKGFSVTGYDKHYFPEFPVNKFDTIICFYVLNVLQPEEQASVLIQISQLIKPTGKAYFAVRRDIRFEGFRNHKIHQKPTYQCIVKLPFKSVFLNENCEIYQYQHYNQINSRSADNCPFCNPTPERILLAESATVYAIKDKYPVNPGHTLIIPKRHCSNYFDLSFKEQSACWFMVNMVKKQIEKEYKTDAFNVGINVNEEAGQTIPHVHIHVIPRFKGDIENPIGGVRGVIPKKRVYRSK